MKLLERDGGRLVFSLAAREKAFLERLLAFYPLQSDASVTFSRESASAVGDATALLDESLREQRDELRLWVSRRLAEGHALRRVNGTWHLALDHDEADRLLRILNELRVSAWHRLGCPADVDPERISAISTDAPYNVILILAGQFQMMLLAALTGGGAAED